MERIPPRISKTATSRRTALCGGYRDLFVDGMPFDSGNVPWCRPERGHRAGVDALRVCRPLAGDGRLARRTTRGAGANRRAAARYGAARACHQFRQALRALHTRRSCRGALAHRPPGRRGRASAPALDGERRAADPEHPGAARLRHTSDQGPRPGSAWRVGGVALGILATRGRDRGPARARCGKRGNGRDRGCRCRGWRLEPEVRKAGAKRGRPDKGAVLAS